jgi:hypothetical protein
MLLVPCGHHLKLGYCGNFIDREDFFWYRIRSVSPCGVFVSGLCQLLINPAADFRKSNGP